METSNEINEFAAAFAAAQANIANVAKTKIGYEDRYRYAELADVLEIARGALNPAGIGILQSVRSGSGETREIFVDTRLIHASGQWVSEVYSMPYAPMKGLTEPQTIGIAITYARRYAIAAMCGIAQFDNDAAAFDPVSEADLERLRRLMQMTGTDARRVLDHFGVEDMNMLTAAQATSVRRVLEQRTVKEKGARDKTSDRSGELKERMTKQLEKEQTAK